MSHIKESCCMRIRKLDCWKSRNSCLFMWSLIMCWHRGWCPRTPTHTRTSTHTHTCTHTHTHAHANARYETQKQAKGDQHKIHCHRLNLRKKQTLKYAHANARNFALSHPLALSLTLVLSHTHHIILHASPTVSIFVRWRLMTPLSKSEKRLLIVLAKSMLQVWSVSNSVREHKYYVCITRRVLCCTIFRIY